MDRPAALGRALLAAVVAFDLAFVFPAWSRARVLWYQPVLRRWLWATAAPSPAMDWYGRTLLATAAALVAFLVMRFVATDRRGAHALTLWTGWATVATLLVMALQVFQLATRQPVPEPLPGWYLPR